MALLQWDQFKTEEQA